MTEPQINYLFASHMLNDKGIGKAVKLAEAFHNFYLEIHGITFDLQDGTEDGWEGREWSIVKTKLEEAAFYAKKSMAIRSDNQTKKENL